VDLSDPDAPLLGAQELGEAVRGTAIGDDRLFVALGSLKGFYDFSGDPVATSSVAYDYFRDPFAADQGELSQTVMVVSGLQSGSFASARVGWHGDPSIASTQLAASGKLLGYAPSFASTISIVERPTGPSPGVTVVG